MNETSQWSVLLQTLLSLGAVIALIYGLAWFVKRVMRPERWGSVGGRDIRILQSFALEPKKKLMIVEVRQQQFLLGLSDQQISLLSTLQPAKEEKSEMKIA